MNQDIRRHVVQTYVNLRVGMSIIAFVLPVLLVLSSILDSRYAVQNSISSYYHTPMRNIFVGALITVGVCLYLYKGFEKLENVLLNFAGIFAIGVALFPARVPEEFLQNSPAWLPLVPFDSPMLHGAFAIIFFATIAYVCIHCSLATVELIQDPKLQRRYLRLYKIYGVLMIVLPVSAAALTFFTVPDYAILAAEASAMWVFAAFWLTKSREVSRQASVLEFDLIVDPVSGGTASA